MLMHVEFPRSAHRESSARVGSRWKAVDRWGQNVGARTLTERDFYDYSGCYAAASGTATVC